MGRELSRPHALEEILRDNLEDDQAWLVYADWLQDQGDVRGRLIVLEQQRDNRSLSIDERDDAGKEADWLVKDHQRSWLMGWRHRVAAELRWKHGFIVGATFPLGEEDPEDDRVLGLSTLLELPAARFLTEVSFERLPSKDLSNLCELLPGSPIRTLGLTGPDGLGEVDVEQLAHSKALGGLRRLELRDSRPGQGGLRALAWSEALERLRALGLSSADLDDEAASVLAGAPVLSGLTRLDLSDNRLGDEGLRALLQSSSRLEELYLSGNVISDAGALALARSGALPSLRVLDLSNNGLTDEGAVALVRSPALKALDTLDLSSNLLTEEGTAALTESDLYARGALQLYYAWE